MMAGTVDLVLEIGLEELPARFVPGALEQLQTNGAKLFAEARLGELNPPEVYGTPRRLLFVLRNVAEKQEPQVIELKGPSVKASRTPDGEWTPAAVGFAAKAGVETSQLVEREGYFYAIRRDEGQTATQVASAVFPQLIRSLTFPKTMRWGSGSFRFGRPIRWITALCGEDIAEFDIEGVKAGRTSYGHRFLARQAFEALDSAHLLSELTARFCLYNQDERRKEIVRQLDSLATEVGGRVAWDAVGGLLDEVTQMVEWPKAYVGSYDQRFLALPRCVTIEIMRKHQQYFPLETPSGELLPHFVVVTNGSDNRNNIVISGNEKVLRARLSDGEFFFARDRSQRLEEFCTKLEGVVFQQNLGTMSQKTARVRRLCGLFAKELGWDDSLARKLDRAAALCKADLATQMVMELPSLQGKIGREYALLDGEDVEVAEAVGEQYTGVPRGRVGKLLALADRLDSLGALYASGARPTGAGDPLGLRRLAQTSVEIELVLSEESPGFRIRSQHLSLTETELKVQGLEVAAAAQEVESYLVERFRGILLENGVRYDVADAICAGRLRENRGVAIRVARLLEERRRQGDASYLALAQAASRVGNILVQAEKKGLQFQEDLPSPANFREEAELALQEAVDFAQKNGDLSVADEAFEQLTRLIPPITRFFDQVMVMCDDEALRSVRLSLLAALRREFMKVADFSKLVQDMESRAA